ncbi:aromatic-ring-hydroxylating dioxygenase subunit beta [Lentzea flava]|uniref:Ring-hydroxylating dioxygenase subunit beta n=1 Tax=Lentzea flava TaxID=103732 RepID=A0ABQ2ULF0_9PSEU|nr:aromatic-ring-hydroxylating dioxygenase subunit beta [Lentzea flava]MCP2200560.1 anthranilate 1,2-dioxygenase small subunit [Lentzea flava]GGU43509.1 ring-hydroxylating dioxygenase subunit beta [Lentzea flava]
MSELRDEIEELYARYAELLDDDCDLDGWLDLFLDDTRYELISRENFQLNLPVGLIICENKGMLKDRLFAMRELMLATPRWTRRVIGNLRVRAMQGDEVHVRAGYIIAQGLRAEPLALFSAGEFRDILTRGDDGNLRFRHKLTIYDHDLIANSVVKPL